MFLVNQQFKWFIGLLSLLFFAILNNLEAQELPLTSAQEVVDRYMQAIGGRDRWESLNSRKTREKYDIYESTIVSESIDRTLDYTKYFKAPNSYLDVWFENLFYSVYASNSDCVWFYSDKGVYILFLNKKYLKVPAKLPKLGILEVIGLPMVDNVTVEDGMFRVDFEDETWGRTISVYFDRESFLVRKHSYSNDGKDMHEYYYKDYRNKNGFLEPYLIENFVNYTKFKVTTIEEVIYNVDIDPTIFQSPLPCPLDGEINSIKLENNLPYIY
ncbi:MAG: hypothetical protein AAF600_18235 [Bacteroidota bacterium]